MSEPTRRVVLVDRIITDKVTYPAMWAADGTFYWLERGREVPLEPGSVVVLEDTGQHPVWPTGISDDQHTVWKIVSD